MPTSAHLQILAPRETVKVIAVVALPEIPKMFRSLVRSGLRKAAPTFGMAIDYASKLSMSFGYNHDGENVAIVIINDKVNGTTVIMPTKHQSDEEVLAAVIKAAKNS